MQLEALLNLANNLPEFLPWLWSLVLLVVRYGMLLLIFPGIGLGAAGRFISIPASLVMAYASLQSDMLAPVPAHWMTMIISVICEAAFGSILGLLPLLVVSGVQMGAGIASTTMGLSASNLIDPTTGGQVPDLARLFGDLTIVFFLSFGGYVAVIYGASGIGASFIPGQPFFFGGSAQLLLEKTNDLFSVGVLISAPVVVALLLTQFVMGLVTKAVPTINIFIISFPVTIGIGLVLSALMLPELVTITKEQFREMEKGIVLLLEEREQGGGMLELMYTTKRS
jgi:flagellar biosynthetic protein FliR